MKDILLSFLEVGENNFEFMVYRKPYDNAPKTDDQLKVYNLPGLEKEKYEPFYVGIDPREDFSSFKCDSHTNRDLTRYVLLEMLRVKIDETELKYSVKASRFQNFIEIYTEDHPKGKRAITFTPYYLEYKKRFGFLIDVHFRANENYLKPDIDTLKLSFSLDRFGGTNRNFYADKYNYISQYLSEILPLIDMASCNILQLPLLSTFSKMPISTLSKKQYVFNQGQIDSNQYRGITKFSPYKLLSQPCTFIFVMEDRFRPFANKLFLSLIGKQNPGTFQGMRTVFHVEMSKENVHRVRILDTSRMQLDAAISDIKQIASTYPNTKPIVIFIEENSDTDSVEVSDTYYYLKYSLTKNKIPLQVISHERINVEKTLKWSTSNIALALFSKLGGIPWVVRPSTSNCLILGIGSAHKIGLDGTIERYFAYTVCLDSSGVYRKLEVLADDHSEESYLEALKRNLTNLLSSDEFSTYSKCALHLPFKIKYSEISSIQEVISNIRVMEFKVIKINTKNKFFGYSEHNTRTPYESTLVKLNRSEFLVWFEGLQFGAENLNQRVSPPVHIQFLNSDYTSKESVDSYLQDIINLTGTNWRGFNAKTKPISIYYSTIIAKYCRHFEEFPNFRKEILSLDIPWFL